MSILSNHTPECLVRAEVSCKIKDLESKEITDSKLFANKFITAIEIAENNISRAVTHNKGIMNGIDSVVIATGNDFRAVEASAHSYASITGKYRVFHMLILLMINLLFGWNYRCQLELLEELLIFIL